MTDPFPEISQNGRQYQFDKYAAYRVDGIDYPAQDIIPFGFRKDRYESDDGGFKGYGDPEPVRKRPSRIPKIDYDKKWLKDDVVEFAKPEVWVCDPLRALPNQNSFKYDTNFELLRAERHRYLRTRVRNRFLFMLQAKI